MGRIFLVVPVTDLAPSFPDVQLHI
jgi:hypothetical protein